MSMTPFALLRSDGNFGRLIQPTIEGSAQILDPRGTLLILIPFILLSFLIDPTDIVPERTINDSTKSLGMTYEKTLTAGKNVGMTLGETLIAT